jgi:hypothetical protein
MWWGKTMRFRENLPMAVMTAVSAAILTFFVYSDATRQLDGCGRSEEAAIGPIWLRVGHSPQASWNPAFPPSPPSGRQPLIGCTKSSTTAIG